MARPWQALLFDFDYTLADPSAGVEICVNFALENLGLPAAPPEQVRRTAGLSLADTFHHLAGADHLARTDDFFRLFVGRAEEVMIDATTMLAGVPAAIRELKRQGLSLGIVSMKYRRHIEPVLAREKLLDAFDVIVGGEDIRRPKPDPEGVRQALAALDRPDPAAYVGDGPADAETARQAGLPFIAVLTGGTSRADLAAYPVEAVLEHVGQLPGWLMA